MRQDSPSGTALLQFDGEQQLSFGRLTPGIFQCLVTGIRMLQSDVLGNESFTLY